MKIYYLSGTPENYAKWNKWTLSNDDCSYRDGRLYCLKENYSFDTAKPALEKLFNCSVELEEIKDI